MTVQEKFYKARSAFRLLVEIDKWSEDLTSLLDDDYLQFDYHVFVTHLEDCLARLGYTQCLDYSGTPTFQLRDSSNKVVFEMGV